MRKAGETFKGKYGDYGNRMLIARCLEPQIETDDMENSTLKNGEYKGNFLFKFSE